MRMTRIISVAVLVVSTTSCTTTEQREFAEALGQVAAAMSASSMPTTLHSESSYDRSFTQVVRSQTPDEFLERSNEHLATFGQGSTCVDNGRSTCGKR